MAATPTGLVLDDENKCCSLCFDRTDDMFRVNGELLCIICAGYSNAIPEPKGKCVPCPKCTEPVESLERHARFCVYRPVRCISPRIETQDTYGIARDDDPVPRPNQWEYPSASHRAYDVKTFLQSEGVYREDDDCSLFPQGGSKIADVEATLSGDELTVRVHTETGAGFELVVANTQSPRRDFTVPRVDNPTKRMKIDATLGPFVIRHRLTSVWVRSLRENSGAATPRPLGHLSFDHIKVIKKPVRKVYLDVKTLITMGGLIIVRWQNGTVFSNYKLTLQDETITVDRGSSTVIETKVKRLKVVFSFYKIRKICFTRLRSSPGEYRPEKYAVAIKDISATHKYKDKYLCVTYNPLSGTIKCPLGCRHSTIEEYMNECVRPELRVSSMGSLLKSGTMLSLQERIERRETSHTYTIYTFSISDRMSKYLNRLCAVAPVNVACAWRDETGSLQLCAIDSPNDSVKLSMTGLARPICSIFSRTISATSLCVCYGLCVFGSQVNQYHQNQSISVPGKYRPKPTIEYRDVLVDREALCSQAPSSSFYYLNRTFLPDSHLPIHG